MVRALREMGATRIAVADVRVVFGPYAPTVTFEGKPADADPDADLYWSAP